MHQLRRGVEVELPQQRPAMGMGGQVNQRANHNGARAECQFARSFEIIVTEQLLGYEPSVFSRDKLAYV
jgi:hypothetical protein